jgi:hypothetical protein
MKFLWIIGIVASFALGIFGPQISWRPSAEKTIAPAPKIISASKPKTSLPTPPKSRANFNLQSEIKLALEQTDSWQRLNALTFLLPFLDSQKIPTLLSEVEKLPESKERDFLLAQLIGTWADQDIQAALKYLEGDPSRKHNSEILVSILSSWVQTDVKAALEWLETIKPASFKESILHKLIPYIAEVEPTRAMQLASGIKDSRSKRKAMQDSLKVWIRKDPTAAIEWFSTFEDEKLRSPLLRAMISQWAAFDPKSAAEFSSKLEEKERMEAWSSIASKWISINPSEALTWLATLAKETSSKLMTDAILKWSDRDPMAAAQYALDKPELNDSLMNLASKLFISDSDGALRWAENIRDPQKRLLVLDGIFGQWMKQDITAAAQYLIGLSSDPAQPQLASKLINKWAVEDIQSATAWAQTLSGPTRTSAMSQLISRWMRFDEAAAAAFGMNLPPEELGSSAQAIAGYLVRTNPQQALDWISKLPAGPTQTSAIDGLKSEWTRMNFATASPLIDAIPESAIRTQLLPSLVKKWTSEDAYETSLWLSKQSVSPSKDAAVAAFSEKIVSSDVEGAAQWALSIQDANLRQQTLAKTFTAWIKKDSKAAQTWLESSGLSSEEKARLQSPPQTNKTPPL